MGGDDKNGPLRDADTGHREMCDITQRWGCARTYPLAEMPLWAGAALRSPTLEEPQHIAGKRCGCCSPRPLDIGEHVAGLGEEYFPQRYPM